MMHTALIGCAYCGELFPDTDALYRHQEYQCVPYKHAVERRRWLESFESLRDPAQRYNNAL